MRWGFFLAQRAKFTLKHMHARSETVDSSPRFCDAFGERRGIVMAKPSTKGRNRPDGGKKQFVVRPRDRSRSHSR